MKRWLPLAVVGALLAQGCPLGPDYETPPMVVPEDFRAELPAEEAQSLADLPWWEVFEDPALQLLIAQAVADNYDLQAAAARVRQSSSFVGIARSELFPQLGYDGTGTRQRSPLTPSAEPQTFNVFTGAFDLAWEVDLWGRIRRATEAAEAQMLATEEVQRGILLTLVSEVARSYFRLLELDRALAISRETRESFEHSLDLFQRRYEGGVGSDLAVARAEAALADVAAEIPLIEGQIVLLENRIRLLVSLAPGPVERGTLAGQIGVPQTPAGLPSELMERRPDIREAEERVRAANATIGVAVANFFPRIGLSGLYGASSAELSDMLSGSMGIWNLAAAVSGPLFTGGRNYEQYKAEVAAWEATVALYKQTVLRAFAEVSDILTAQQKLVAERAQREIAVASLQRSVELALLRYELGLADYFEVIDAQQELYPAQLDLARVRRTELALVARLYSALGGGWDLPDDQWVGQAPETGEISVGSELGVDTPPTPTGGS